MPRIEKVYTLEIKLERFLDACSREELIELELLLSSPRYQKKIRGEDKYIQTRIPD